MGKILQELEVEEEKLILEKEAVDTTTNARNVLKLVQDEVLVKQVVLEEAQMRIWVGGGGWVLGSFCICSKHLLQEKVRLIIVTTAYHMPRSAWLFRSRFHWWKILSDKYLEAKPIQNFDVLVSLAFLLDKFSTQMHLKCNI